MTAMPGSVSCTIQDLTLIFDPNLGVSEGMIVSESVGAAELFTRVEHRIRTLRYGKGCQGAFSVTVLFHQPSLQQ